MRAPTSPGSLEQLLASNSEAALDRRIYRAGFSSDRGDRQSRYRHLSRRVPRAKAARPCRVSRGRGSPVVLGAADIFALRADDHPGVDLYSLRNPQATIRFLAWLVTHTVYKIHVHQRHNLPEEGAALLTAQPCLVDRRAAARRGFVATGPSDYHRRLGHELVGPRLGSCYGGDPDLSTQSESGTEIDRNGTQGTEQWRTCLLFLRAGFLVLAHCNDFAPARSICSRGPTPRSYPSTLMSCGGVSLRITAGDFFGSGRDSSHGRFRFGSAKSFRSLTTFTNFDKPVQELGADAVTGRKERMMVLPRLMLRKCRKAMFRFKMADTTGAELTAARS